MKINFKQLMGIVGLAFGLGLIVYAAYSMREIAKAKEEVHGIASWFADHPFGDFLGGVLEEKAAAYDQTVIWLLVAGAVLLVLGVAFFLMSRKKSDPNDKNLG